MDLDDIDFAILRQLSLNATQGAGRLGGHAAFRSPLLGGVSRRLRDAGVVRGLRIAA